MGQTDSGKKALSFDCKEGCGEKVIYERENVIGFTTDEAAKTETKIVYLTCPNGHTYPYTVTGGG